MLKPRIKLSHQILRTEDNNFSFGEAGPNVFIVKNPPEFFADFILLLDGTHTQVEICNEIIAQYSYLNEKDVLEVLHDLGAMHLLEDAALSSHELTAEELERYDREMLYFSLMETQDQPGFVYQEQLKHSHVIIFGMGSWGTWLAVNLSLAGIGELTLIDGDTVSLSNLNRQVLFEKSDIGIPKVVAMQTHLQKINPHVKVNIHYQQVTNDENMISSLIKPANLIILAWTNYGYFMKNTLEEKIHKIALDNKIAVMELASDPLNVYVGPIYSNQAHSKSYFDLREIIKKRWLNSSSELNEFKTASLKNNVLNKDRRLNAWQYAPSLSAMAGIACSEILKFLGGFYPCNIINKRFSLDLMNLTSQVEDFS